MKDNIIYNEWLPYTIGGYKKQECDVRSHHGLIYKHCWPNAGKFEEMCGKRRSVAERYIAEIMYIEYYQDDSCETCKKIKVSTEISGEAYQYPSTGSGFGSNVKQYIRDKPKVGRNDKCSCGSGLKYKKCCIQKT